VTILPLTAQSLPGHEPFTHPPGEDRTTEDLEERAREIGTEGRSDMSKDELIDALSDTSSGWRARSKNRPSAAGAVSVNFREPRPAGRTQARGRPAFPLLF
jgi:hypothetical protein